MVQTEFDAGQVPEISEAHPLFLVASPPEQALQEDFGLAEQVQVEGGHRQGSLERLIEGLHRRVMLSISRELRIGEVLENRAVADPMRLPSLLPDVGDMLDQERDVLLPIPVLRILVEESPMGDVFESLGNKAPGEALCDPCRKRALTRGDRATDLDTIHVTPMLLSPALLALKRITRRFGVTLAR